MYIGDIRNEDWRLNLKLFCLYFSFKTIINQYKIRNDPCLLFQDKTLQCWKRKNILRSSDEANGVSCGTENHGNPKWRLASVSGNSTFNASISNGSLKWSKVARGWYLNGWKCGKTLPTDFSAVLFSGYQGCSSLWYKCNWETGNHEREKFWVEKTTLCAKK
jgi:hypothetical protein